jgi:hypothetical protein
LIIHTQTNPCRHWTAIETIAGDNVSSGVTLEFIEDRGVFEKAMEIKKVGDLFLLYINKYAGV